MRRSEDADKDDESPRKRPKMDEASSSKNTGLPVLVHLPQRNFELNILNSSMVLDLESMLINRGINDRLVEIRDEDDCHVWNRQDSNDEHMKKTLDEMSIPPGSKINVYLSRTGVELLVFYDGNNFFPVPDHPEMQECGIGMVSWPRSYARYQIPSITAGLKTFQEICDVLTPLFTGEEIREIKQWCGKVAGKEVAMVTSHHKLVDTDNEVELAEGEEYSPYCDADGNPHSWEEAGKPRWEQRIHRGSSRRVLICNGQRTVMEINHIAPYDIFISYQWDSKGIVRKVYGQLMVRGFSCRMSEPDTKSRDAELKSCKVILIFVTKEYINSDYCKNEGRRAYLLRRQSKTPFPVILPLVLKNAEWSSSDVEMSLKYILALKNSCIIHEEDVYQWTGERIDNFMGKLKTIIGVELLVLYDDEDFSPFTDRPEIQDWGEKSWYLPRSYMKCHFSGTGAGWKSFEELQSILRPLFHGEEIRSIEQCRGEVDGKDLAMVTSFNEDTVEKYLFDSQFCDVDGKMHVGPLLGTGRLEQHRIHAESIHRFLVCGRRRTVLWISECFPPLFSVEEEEDATSHCQS